MTGKQYFDQFVNAADSDLVLHDGYVNCSGASGAVTEHFLGGDVVITKESGTGLYSVIFNRKYPQLKHVSVSPVLVSTTDITYNVTQADTTISNTDQLNIQFKTAGSAANLPQGSGFFLQVIHKNNTLKPGS